MYHRIKILMAISFLLSCSTGNHLSLDTKLIDQKKNNEKILLPSGEPANSTSVIEKNIKYSVGLSSKSKIIFISTIDKNFNLNGLKVGNTLPFKYLTGNKIKYIPGWGYYIKIDSEWFAGFDFQIKPDKDSKIGWFFKYDF